MSLKYVHLVFIALAIVVTVIFGLWALGASVPIAIAAFVASAVEADYARWFLRKARDL